MAVKLEQLLDKINLLIKKDLDVIAKQSMSGKLKPTSSKDLVAYHKVLSEALSNQKAKEEEQQDNASKLSEKELIERAKKAIGRE